MMKEQKRSTVRTKSKSAVNRSERSDVILDIERAHDPAGITQEARTQWEDSLVDQHPARLDRIYANLVKLLDSSTLHDETHWKTVREYVDLIRWKFRLPKMYTFHPRRSVPSGSGHKGYNEDYYSVKYYTPKEGQSVAPGASGFGAFNPETGVFQIVAVSTGNQVQVYRLSDLSLIKTIRLPTNDAPNEPRVLEDGRTVLVNTVACRLYHVTGLEGIDPKLEMVHEQAAHGCAMPVVIGHFWLQSSATDHLVFSLDIRDLKAVRSVSSVSFDDRQRPHWLATDGARIVVVNEPAPTAERRIWMLQLNRAPGQLTLDEAFRDAGSTRPGLGFDRATWPHGATGTAVPHGTVFGW